MSATLEKETTAPRRPSEMRPLEFGRWIWRQLTSMRTALILLLLLALAAVPGSLIPQESQDAQKTTSWQTAHPHLAPIYSRLDLFSVFNAPWFAAIYLLLMVSLIGCIVPRLVVYARGLTARPPAAPRNLTRMPGSASYTTSLSAEEVLDRARGVLKRRRYRLRTPRQARGADRQARGADGQAQGTYAEPVEANSVASERGYLREAGNLIFHFSVILVLIGFAMGGLLGYKGGVIVLVGKNYGFANELTQYDDFNPGSLFSAKQLDWFHFSIDRFKQQWVPSTGGQLMNTAFQSDLSYQTSPTGPIQDYDLRVNHPLTIGSTEVFLIGSGYAPDITVRDGKGHVVYAGPTVFLPEDASYLSTGVVKAPDAEPAGIGLQGLFYPTEVTDTQGDPINLRPDVGDGSAAMLSMTAWSGNLNLGAAPQSVYTLDTSKAKPVQVGYVTGHGQSAQVSGGRAFNLRIGDVAHLGPHGSLGTVTFTGIDQWNRLQISQQPGRQLALGGVCLALLGLLGSLFIRPRRVWVRATETEGGTLVQVAALDRTGGGDTAAVVQDLVKALRAGESTDPEDEA